MSLTLRRYTERPYLIDLLRTCELTLVSPASWDDQNDSFYLNLYAQRTEQSNVFALCLTEASETYHHWKVFSSGTSGVCIEFKRDPLLTWVRKQDGLSGAPVSYKTLKYLRARRPSLDELPFWKRKAFADELEFRLFYASSDKPTYLKRFTFNLSYISRIVLNPWLPRSVADQVKATLLEIPGCETMKIYRSTLVDNESWKSLAANKT